jgi:hypothetical protein
VRRFELLAQDIARRHLRAVCYPFYDGFPGRVESRLIHQRQRITQILRGPDLAHEPESRESVWVLKNRNPVRRGCHGEECLKSSAAGISVQRCLFDGSFAVGRECHQVARPKQ